MSNTDELGQIFAPILADIEPMGTTSGEFARLTDEAIQAIQALIDRECTKARIDTAQYFKRFMISTSPFIDEIVDPYIAELSNKENE